MATDSLVATSGTIAWDVGSNWSLGTVPQATDNVVLAGQQGILSVSIAASDPAYTIASLTQTTTSTSIPAEVLTVSGQLTVTGTTDITTAWLQVGNTGTVTLNAVTVSNSAELIGGNSPTSSLSIGSLAAGTGTIGGTVLVNAGSVSIGSTSGSIGISLSANSVVTIGSLGGAGNLSFSTAGGRVNLQSATTTLGDFVIPGSNSIIDLQSIAYQQGETAATTLVSTGSFFNTYAITLKSAVGQTLYTFQKVSSVGPAFGTQSPPPVTVVSDGTGGTLVTLACYTAGTLIAAPGADRRVQDLAIGDEVITATGPIRRIKWIGRRSYSGRFLQANRRALPIRFQAGALADGIPRRDLLVSPEHAMFIDGLLIPARYLVNGTSIIQEPHLERVEYFHLELDSHDVILAEGAPSETFVDDNSRMMFQNAHDFAAAYPGQGPVPALYCAPRIEHGEKLATIRLRIDARAGLDHPSSGALRGFVDSLEGQTLTGWAQNPARPEAPVCLDVRLDGIVIAQAVADRFRADLQAAGIGSGRHSFRVRLPKTARHGRIEVCRSADGARLGALDLQDRQVA